MNDMELNTLNGGLVPWKTPRRYHRRKGRDRSTPNSTRRVHKAPKMPVSFIVEEGNMMYYTSDESYER